MHNFVFRLLLLVGCVNSASARPYFEENLGQADEEARFLARCRGFEVFLASSRVIFAVPTGDSRGRQTSRQLIEMRLAGQMAPTEFLGLSPLRGRSNYFIGKDPSQWVRCVPHFARVRALNVQPGVDLEFYFREGAFEFDLVLAPGRSPDDLRVIFTGHEGLEEDGKGGLVLRAGGGELRVSPPHVTQASHGTQASHVGEATHVARADERVIASSFSVLGQSQPGMAEVAFAVGSTDPSDELRIDPVIEFSSTIGTSGIDRTSEIRRAANGDLVLAGTTDSISFPLQNPFDSTPANWDCFLQRVDGTSGALIFSTYLGGSGGQFTAGMDLSPSGSICVTGDTTSGDFPLQSPFQSQLGGLPGTDLSLFVSCLDATGSSLVFSTYLGGAFQEEATDLNVAPNGDVWVTANTTSMDWPVRNPLQASLPGVLAGGIARFDPTGNLLFSTFFGGSASDGCQALDIGASGQVTIVGSTTSNDLPVQAAHQPTYGGGMRDGFVLQLDPLGALTSCTYLGGMGFDSPFDVCVHPTSEDIVVAGVTDSVDFPTLNPIQPSSLTPNSTGFVSRLDAVTRDLTFSTYLGGSVTESILGMELEADGDLYLAGATASPDFPTTAGSPPLIGNPTDAFLLKMSTSPTCIVLTSLLVGGSDNEGFLAVTTDGAGRAHVVGSTHSPDFPIVNSASSYMGNGDALRLVIADNACPSPLCGDCNLDGSQNILDALRAAQHAAGALPLTAVEFSNCNVLGDLEPQPTAVVDILDALVIARRAAGIAVTLVCC